MVAISRKEIDAAIAASGIPKADAAGIWPAAKAARDGEPSGTSSDVRRGKAIAAAIAEVAAKSPSVVTTFTAAITAPSAPVSTPATPPTSGTPAPTPAPPSPPSKAVPTKYADAVERSLIAAGAPEAEHAKRSGDFAEAIDKGLKVDEALTRLFEGLKPEAVAAGRARFAGLTDPWWKKESGRITGLFTTWLGRAQLGLLILAFAFLRWAPVPSKGWFWFGLVVVIIANCFSSNRKVLITVNLAFIVVAAVAFAFGVVLKDEWEFK